MSAVKILRVLLAVLVCVLSVVFTIKMPVLVTGQQNDSQFNFDSDALQRHVQVLSVDLIPRTCEKPLELLNSAQYILSEFRKTNSEAYLQSYEHSGAAYTNVVASYGPDTDTVIIVGAHYDAYRTLPGADDNASGVAGLLELSRALSSSRLKTNVQLVAYACEEPPFFAGPGMGSYVHAHSLQGREVSLMISLEMIGYFSSEKASQRFPVRGLSLLYPARGNFVAVVGRLFDANASKLKATINAHTSLDAYSINAPRALQGIDFSDHRNYWSLDYPAVMVTDTAFYRNTNYHTAADSWNTLDYEAMKEVVYGVYVHIVGLANDK